MSFLGQLIAVIIDVIAIVFGFLDTLLVAIFRCHW